YNCGSSDVQPMRTWVEAIARRKGSRSRVWTLPGPLVKPALRALEAARLSPLRIDQYEIADLDYILDTQRAKDELGWAPALSDAEAALQTFDWFLGRQGRA